MKNKLHPKTPTSLYILEHTLATHYECLKSNMETLKLAIDNPDLMVHAIWTEEPLQNITELRSKIPLLEYAINILKKDNK